jgi:hypothetical protein
MLSRFPRKLEIPCEWSACQGSAWPIACDGPEGPLFTVAASRTIGAAAGVARRAAGVPPNG